MSVSSAFQLAIDNKCKSNDIEAVIGLVTINHNLVCDEIQNLKELLFSKSVLCPLSVCDKKCSFDLRQTQSEKKSHMQRLSI